MKKGVPNEKKWHFLVHRESKLNCFRDRVKFVFVKGMEVVKWDERGYIYVNSFSLKYSLALKRTEAR